MEDLAVELFSKVPTSNKKAPVDNWEDAWPDKYTGKFVWYNPISNLNRLTVVVPINISTNPDYMVDPLDFIGYVLNNREKGTLFRYLA